jgi:hypothetical protein
LQKEPSYHDTYYHWSCTTDSQRGRYNDDGAVSDLLKIRPNLGKTVIRDISMDIITAQLPQRQESTNTSTRQSRAAKRERRRAAKKEAKGKTADMDDLRDAEGDEEEDLAMEDIEDAVGDIDMGESD